jgi:hypothetical protein
MTDKTLSLREIANAFNNGAVGNMVKKIKKSFENRDAFEVSQGLNTSEKNSYTVERDRMLNNSVAVARLFLALNLEPSAVIERKVASNAMFNAKALKKVTEIAQFVCGYGQRLERVMRAFIACSIIATEKGHATITNEVNRRFLCGADFSGRLTDQDLIDHLDELRHRAMTSGAETQSSQSRNVLDVLGLGEIKSLDKPRDAIAIDAQHAFYAQFRAAFMK